MQSIEQKNNENPPANTKRIYRWADLPNTTENQTYWVTNTGQDPRKVILAKRTRQVLEGLMRSPIHSASYCRLSDHVLPLRRDHGIDIRCDMFANDVETGRTRYGVYVLVSQVQPVLDKVAA